MASQAVCGSAYLRTVPLSRPRMIHIIYLYNTRTHTHTHTHTQHLSTVPLSRPRRSILSDAHTLVIASCVGARAWPFWLLNASKPPV